MTNPQQPPQFTPPPAPPIGRPHQDPPPAAPSEPVAEGGRPYGFDRKGRVERTKISGVWIGLIAAAVVLVLLIVFIAQNLDTVGLHFLGFYGKVSLGLALLVAAICGLFLAAIPGTVRIMQLRKSLRRNADTSGT